MTAAEWPHIESYSDAETEEHVELKNLAVGWLIERGFPRSSITDEHHVTSDSAFGYTDIYANHQGQEVFIECEVGQCRLSRGGQLPLNDGQAVYMFRRGEHTEDGVFMVGIEIVEAEPSQLSPTSETIEREIVNYTKVSDLPEPPI
jgi:hypothetical protein